MKRQQIVVFFISLGLIAAFSLAYSAQVMADLTTLYQNPGDILGVELVLQPDTRLAPASKTQPLNLLEAQQVVARRLDNLHLAGSYHVEMEGNRLIARLPDNENMPYIASIISSVGEIEFINGGVASPPVGQRVATGPQAGPDLYQTLFTGQEIEAALPPDPAAGQIFYQLTLKPATVQRFANFVETQPDHYICMVMDAQVINCSVMYHRAGDTIEILPGLSSGTAISLADLSIFLNSGPLPIPLKVVTR